MRGTAAEKTTSVIAGNGMLEIGRGGQRLDSFIRELFREEAAEAIAKRLARKVALGAFKFEANEFEAVGPGASETLDG
jgi:hypothetical protein